MKGGGGGGVADRERERERGSHVKERGEERRGGTKKRRMGAA